MGSFFPLASSIKDITNKLQAHSIIPAISPFVDNCSNDDVNIHTDNSLIMNAEEAKESPIRTRSVNSDIEKKFNDIGKQQFNEKILFRQNKHRKKYNAMSASTSSLSSNSSEEKDNCIKPTLMTLSSVGVLPDLRSPESIQNDIEYKEKILANILNLDKVKIVLDNLQNINESCDDHEDTHSDDNSVVVNLNNAAKIVEDTNVDQIIDKSTPPNESDEVDYIPTSDAPPGESSGNTYFPLF